MSCETFNFADELFHILDSGWIYFIFGRLEQNQFNHLYEREENASPTSRATTAGKLVLQGSILL